MCRECNPEKPLKFVCEVRQDKTDLDVDYRTDYGTFGFYYWKRGDMVSIHYNTHRVWRGSVTRFLLFVRAMYSFSMLLGMHTRKPTWTYDFIHAQFGEFIKSIRHSIVRY